MTVAAVDMGHFYFEKLSTSKTVKPRSGASSFVGWGTSQMMALG
jgi:hypothetical protein